MRRFVFSTDGVPDAERVAFWRDHVNDGQIGVTAEISPEPGSAFAAEVVTESHGSLVHFHARGDGFPVFRRSRDIARRGWEDWVWIYQEAGEGARFEQDGRERVSKPGDLIVADPTVPFARQPLRRFDMHLWFLPRALVSPHLPGGRAVRAVQLPGSEGINAILRSYLDGLSEQMARLGPAEADAVADNLCRLVAVACGGAAGEQRSALRAARLEEAKRHIGRHLSDPDLSPHKVAAAMRISVRQLHILFEPTGTTFAQYVLYRRLEECRAVLTSPAGLLRSVADVAYAWGFNSLSTFYRAFRQTFGATPSEMRAAAERRF